MCDFVKVYYPTNATQNKKSFNWFMFAQPSFNEELEMNTLSISSKAQFFCEQTGRSFIIADPSTKPVLLLDDFDEVDKDNLSQFLGCAISMGYDGFAKQKKEDVCNYNACVCEECFFVFKEGILKEEYCGIVPHIIKNNASYKEIYGDLLPGPEEIRDMVSSLGCLEVSKLLYKSISERIVR